MGFANKPSGVYLQISHDPILEERKTPPETVVLLQIQCNKFTSHQQLDN